MKFIKFTLCIMAALMLAGNAYADIFATTLIDNSASLNSSGYYNNPNNLLDKPTLFIPAWGGGTSHVSIVEPAYGENTLTTFNSGDWAVVKFDHQVMDDPNNPYGLDFIAYGNAFYVGQGFVYDTTDHGNYNLTGGIFAEPLKISVSQYGTDDWYTYEDGPYGDTLYPTNPWEWNQALWDSTGNGWNNNVENNFALPVDPSLTLANMTAGTSADAMALYAGSAGGAGFDLAESGYEWIEYIRVEGVSGFSGGEIDAFSDVAAVPIPGAVWLLVSGMIGLIGSRKYFSLK